MLKQFQVGSGELSSLTNESTKITEKSHENAKVLECTFHDFTHFVLFLLNSRIEHTNLHLSVKLQETSVAKVRMQLTYIYLFSDCKRICCLTYAEYHPL